MGKTKIGSIENHRSREKNTLVYPVYSRRSRGLSVGINLFPDRKHCSFDCPYCEVFPFAHNVCFEAGSMEEDLISVLADSKERNIEVKDICFSGNGEPSLSPDFPLALEKAISIRDRLVPNSEVVLITNGTGLLDENLFNLLAEKACNGLRIWLKIDAATEPWFTQINRPSGIDFLVLLNRIRDFAAVAPFIAQTMICKISGNVPPPDEEQAWLRLVTELALPGKLRSVQIYGKARPSPMDPLAESVDVSFLEKRVELLRVSLKETILVGVFP